MKKKIAIQFALIVVPIFYFGIANAGNSIETFVRNENAGNRSKLADSHKRILDSQYPGHSIHSVCSAEIDGKNVDDVVLGILDKARIKATYLAIIGNTKPYIVEMKSSVVNASLANDMLVIRSKDKSESSNIFMHCMKSAEAKEYPWGDINPINSHDVACLQDFESPTTFECYSYDSESRRFVAIGGWVN